MASYGQLVGQPTYDDSGLFDRPGAAPESEAASSSRSSPALKITVTDPLKKVSRCREAPEFVLSDLSTPPVAAFAKHLGRR